MHSWWSEDKPTSGTDIAIGGRKYTARLGSSHQHGYHTASIVTLIFLRSVLDRRARLMSRVPPFPAARRPQTPSSSEYDYLPQSPNTTRPLQINRPPTRPTTPSSRSVNAGPSTSPPVVPMRPQRSGLRGRQVSEYSNSDRASIDSRYGEFRDSRDSAAYPPARPPRNGVNGKPKTSNGSIDTNGMLSPLSPSSEPEVSPQGAAAIAAFQHAMARRRDKARDDYMDSEYEKEKQREIAIQMDRQRRIREKVPGRKATKPRAGDIDGESCNPISQLFLTLGKLFLMRLRMSGRLSQTRT